MDGKRFDFDNYLLNSLSPQDLIEISKALEPVGLDRMTYIHRSNEPIAHVYFLEDGVASTVAYLKGRREIEVAVTGREGVTGTALILGADRSPHDCYMQVAGSAYRITADNFRQLMTESATLSATLLSYVNAFLVQVEWNAHANGIVKLQHRLARWLLMIHDRTRGNTFNITHEFLSVMLSARRPGVTVGLQIFEGEGLIRAARGTITVLDRQGLIEASYGSYGPSEQEYRRLLSGVSGISCTGVHNGYKGDHPWHDEKSRLSQIASWTSFWRVRTRRRHLRATGCSIN